MHKVMILGCWKTWKMARKSGLCGAMLVGKHFSVPPQEMMVRSLPIYSTSQRLGSSNSQELHYIVQLNLSLNF